MSYPAPGDPTLSRRVSDLLAPAAVRLDPARGLDHGVWSLLVTMYPNADVPVVQLGMAQGAAAAFHYGVGQRLAPLRDEGVLILGSGNVVHNLRYWGGKDARMASAGTRFNDEVKRCIAARDHRALESYSQLDPESATLAVPTSEHFLPLIYILALQAPGEPATVFNDAHGGAIFMTSVLLGGDELSPLE